MKQFNGVTSVIYLNELKDKLPDESENITELINFIESLIDKRYDDEAVIEELENDLYDYKESLEEAEDKIKKLKIALEEEYEKNYD